MAHGVAGVLPQGGCRGTVTAVAGAILSIKVARDSDTYIYNARAPVLFGKGTKFFANNNNN